MTLHEGDCVEVMRGLEPCSVDAVVCDPPYGLEFMGKTWDRLWRDYDNDSDREYRSDGRNAAKFQTRRPSFGSDGRAMQEWHEAWAREALRVLKPGGHLLAFGGTRTFHRLACALEDAGFEIRDCLSWLYGSGFPKSLDVGKAIDRQRVDNPDWQRVGAWLRAQRQQAGLSAKETCARLGFHGEVNHGGAVSNWENGSSCPTWEQWVALRDLFGADGSMDAEVWRLNGRKGQPGDAWHDREVLSTRQVKDIRNGHGREYGSALFAGEETGLIDHNETLPATPEAARWDGWGTALKPAWEPIVVARKPLSGTVAGNVLEHGTGALNIDATRIGTNGESWDGNEANAHEEYSGKVYGAFGKQYAKPSHAGGRWPANVVLSHDPGCVQVGTRRVKSQNPQYAAEDRGASGYDGGWQRRPSGVGIGHADADGLETVEAWECVEGCPVHILDQQSGEVRYNPAGEFGVAKRATGTIYGGISRPGTSVYGYGDRGGASRFFYTSKSSRAERNAGLEGLPEQPPPFGAEKGDGLGRGISNTRQDWPVRNTHPTVKPVAVMRWLCRLVTPPNGTILDPFLGSGTTGIAAALEGFQFVGIEREAEYLEIARRRIAYWAEHGEAALVEVRRQEAAERVRETVAESGQLDLLGS